VLDRLVSEAACHSVTAQPTALLSVLNLMGEGILLLDDRCNTLWANTVFASALRADPECDRILTVTRRLAAAVTTAEEACSTGSSTSRTPAVAQFDVHTPVARYALRATRIVLDPLSPERPFQVVVSMVTALRRVPDAEALAKRFGLTPSEAAVALLLARGLSNRDVARTLAVSAHTARHHTEHVLLKLCVHTRAAVGGLLLDADPPRAPDQAVTRPRLVRDGTATARREGEKRPLRTPDDRPIRPKGARVRLATAV